MRISTILTVGVVLVISSPVVSGGDANQVTEAMAKEHMKEAEEKIAEAHAAVKTLEAEIRSQTVERQEEPRAANLRGSNAQPIARSAVTPPAVVDEEEAELAEEQAKEALAKNDFEEAVTEMAKFFEFKELRAAGMRERSAELDKLQKESSGEGAP